MRFGRMKKSRGEAVFTLIEMMIAILVMTIGVFGLMSLLTIATVQNANQGDSATRTTEYAQDKMEQLMVLAFNDGTSNLTLNPACIVGVPEGTVCTGTGLGGALNGTTTPVGGLNPSSPVSGYVDYISKNGTPGPSSTGAAYIRQWQITADGNSPARIKTIRVRVTALSAIGTASLATSTLVCQKAAY